MGAVPGQLAGAGGRALGVGGVALPTGEAGDLGLIPLSRRCNEKARRKPGFFLLHGKADYCSNAIVRRLVVAWLTGW
ncbi:hypothetical protein COK69_26580, partial [Bacillus cereus]